MCKCTHMLSILVVFSFLLSCCKCETPELLHNNDFENRHAISPWICIDCTAKVIQSTKYHGQSSVLINRRLHDYSTIAQKFSLHGDHNYKCSAYVKLLNTGHGKPYERVDAVIVYHINGKAHYIGIGINEYIEANTPFAEIGGDFHIPAGVNSIRFYIKISDPTVNFIVDSASCKQILHDSNWRTHALQRIDNIRKGSLTIQIASKSNTDTSGLSVEIHQTKSKFAFGTAIKSDFINDDTYKPYQDWVYNNFEWAVDEYSMKWKPMEKTKGHVNYDKPLRAVQKLKSHGFKIRGHNMFWDITKDVPEWLKTLPKSQILQEMHRRVEGVMNQFKGTLEHWDVNNENLHGHYFEEHTQSNITQQMFKWMHTKDPSVKLFLNDYGIVSYQSSTTAFKTLGKTYKDSGVPLYGMGVQSHFYSSNIDMDILKYRLDKVAEVGLPIWITELTIREEQDNKKATVLDNVMTMYLSHPAVEGVLLWGFWDIGNDPKDALVNGKNVIPNAAGRKWQDLFHHRFRTNEVHSFHGAKSIHTKIFYGEHKLVFKRNGRTIHTETISFNNGGKTATVHLQGSGDNVHISSIGFG